MSEVTEEKKGLAFRPDDTEIERRVEALLFAAAGPLSAADMNVMRAQSSAIILATAEDIHIGALQVNNGWETGCPVRIRTSIDGVRVRSLTIRRRGIMRRAG